MEGVILPGKLTGDSRLEGEGRFNAGLVDRHGKGEADVRSGVFGLIDRRVVAQDGRWGSELEWSRGGQLGALLVEQGADEGEGETRAVGQPVCCREDQGLRIR
jgi:hypothetical protein